MVASGLALLTIVGVATIFGNTIAAVLAPTRTETAATASPSGAPRTPVPAGPNGPAAPAVSRHDGGSASALDGNS
jgi:hypothetical protein